MAEESGGDGWWGAWGTDFISTVKAKSAETLLLVKHDLSEFVTTIHHDTTITIAETASTVKDQLKVDEDEADGSTTAAIKQGMSQWLGSFSATLRDNISQIAAIIDEEPTVSTPGPLFDRTRARLYEIQTDPATYCNDPDGHPVHYEEWCEGFDLEQRKADISELLVNRLEIRSLYTKLVPSAVTHTLFWHRYFYKLHQLKQEEKRRAALVERANNMQEDELGWDDEEDVWDTEDNSKEHLERSVQEDRLTNRDVPREGDPIAHQPTENDSILPQVDPQKSVASSDAEEKTTKPAEKFIENTEVDEGVQKTLEILDELQVVEISEGEGDSKDVDDKPADVHTSTQDSKIIPKEQSILELEKYASVLEHKEVKRQDFENANYKEASSKGHMDDKKEESLPEPQQEGEAELYLANIAKPCQEREEKKTPRVAEAVVTDGEKDEIKRENSSNGSVDSSWSKISEEELKNPYGNGTTKDTRKSVSANKGASPSPSDYSSSSAVLVPAVDDKDLDWDDDLDFDDDDVIGDDAGPKTTSDKDVDANQDIDEEDWENWE